MPGSFKDTEKDFFLGISWFSGSSHSTSGVILHKSGMKHKQEIYEISRRFGGFFLVWSKKMRGKLGNSWKFESVTRKFTTSKLAHAHRISSSGMQTRVSSSPPRARKDTTDFFTLRRALRALARLITPAATTAAALGALTFGVALGALEEVAVCIRVELLGACTKKAIDLT